jgi:pimeloyl-ACP methyl ester carboxylesterase
MKKSGDKIQVTNIAETAKTAQPKTGYSDVARVAVQETAARVQEMHQAIAGKSFDVLTRIPIVSGPAALAKAVHDAISGGVYAAIHHGSAGVLGAASMIERNLPAGENEGSANRTVSSVRSALNAAFGDHFAGTNNVLAIAMGLYVDGREVPLSSDTLLAAFPQSGKRLCLLMHGLAFDEHCWESGDEADKTEFAPRLEKEFGYTPLYLRYNTGLPIDDNGTRLAILLEQLLATWPEPVEELLLIGHSMGGLIGRNACEQAAAAGLIWPQLTSMLICLGSPHLGSPWERLGHATNTALQLSDVTAPLGRIAAARSQGIKDLRHGPEASDATPHDIAFRFLGSTMTDDIDHPLAEWFGDGLVTLGSSTSHPITGDVKSVRLGGIGHMALTTEPRVYAQLSQWLEELDHG